MNCCASASSSKERPIACTREVSIALQPFAQRPCQATQLFSTSNKSYRSQTPRLFASPSMPMAFRWPCASPAHLDRPETCQPLADAWTFISHQQTGVQPFRLLRLLRHSFRKSMESSASCLWRAGRPGSSLCDAFSGPPQQMMRFPQDGSVAAFVAPSALKHVLCFFHRIPRRYVFYMCKTCVKRCKPT